MNEQLIVIEKTARLTKRIDNPQLQVLKPRSTRALLSLMASDGAGVVCVGEPKPVVSFFSSVSGPKKSALPLVLLGSTSASDRSFLSALFHSVVVTQDETHQLSTEDMLEVLSSPFRANHAIGGTVAPAAKALVLMRGNLESLVVPFAWFRSRPGGPKPDFSRFEVADYGQTVKLGAYEAAMDAILYEFDEDYRRAEKKRRVSTDTSWGGALRRLRLQRGLSRDDFPGVTAKTIARLERGEVKQPHDDTLKVLAARLGVKPEAIAEF